jgi:hypothetical protein
MNAEVAVERAAPTSPLLALLPASTEGALRRMFADPYLLERAERGALVADLRAAAAARPEVAELRVLLGMALCVNFEVPEALEALREGVRLSPDSYIAQLKLGELWMRLRVCDRAEHHTRQAALLARSALQSELARRQAREIRELVRHGIRRGGHAPGGLRRVLAGLGRRWRRGGAEALATGETG